MPSSDDLNQWIVYLGERDGTFTINSRSEPGLKYQVAFAVPFAIHPKDTWIANMRGCNLLSPISFIPDIIRQPLHDLTYLSRYEAALLEGLAASCPDPARIVELGTGKGLSTARLLYGLTLHEDAKVWTFDLTECKLAREYIEHAQIPNWRYEFVIGDSSEMAATFAEILDMIYIDASHSYEGAKKDIIAWTPKLKAGGIMALHDYGNKKHEVTFAIDEMLFNDGDNWTYKARADSLVAFEKV